MEKATKNTHLNHLEDMVFLGHVDGTRDAVRALLDYFETKKIQSTWATVGALALSNWEEFFSIMTLSKETINKLADALTLEVIDF